MAPLTLPPVIPRAPPAKEFAKEVRLKITGALPKASVMNLSMRTCSTVSEVKRKIFDIVKIHPQVQRLSCKGADFTEDHNTLSSLGNPTEMRLALIRFEEKVTLRLMQLAREGDADAATRALKGFANPDYVDPADGIAPLHAAAVGRHLATAQALCDWNADKDKLSRDGFAPLHYAANLGYQDMVGVLAEAGANVSRQSKDGQTAIYIAANLSNMEMVKFLLEAKADTSLMTERGWGPLHVAASKPDPAMVKALLRGKAKPDLHGPPGHEPAILLAVKVGCIEIVQMMTEDDAMDGEIVLCQATTSGWTPLHACVLSGDGDMLRLLLEGKANPRLKTETGETTLHVAAAAGHVDFLAPLKKYGADPGATMRGGVSPMHLAVALGRTDVVGALRKIYCEVNSKRDDGVTPLILAIKANDHEMVRFLLQLKIGGDPDYMCPLQVAAECGNLEAVRLLCTQWHEKLKPANLDKRGEDGSYPIFTAALRGYTEIVKHLVLCKAQMDVVPRNDKTKRVVMHVAAELGDLQMVQCLCESGADKDKAMMNGWTPLHVACHQDHPEVVKFLCGAKCDLERQTEDGWTPLLVAAQQGNRNLALQLVHMYGADTKVPRQVAEQSQWDEVLDLLGKLGGAGQVAR